jgi:hypothetical protein
LRQKQGLRFLLIPVIARQEILPHSRPVASQVLAVSAQFSQLPLRPPDYHQQLQAEALTSQEKAATLIINHIETKRAAPGLDSSGSAPNL